MLNHKTYRDIVHLNDDIALDFKRGSTIIVQEKIDGANASFQYDSESGTIAAFSHHKPLSEDNDLRGFWQFSQKLDVQLVKQVLGDNLRMFGEWLVPHSVVYPKECYYKYYCFDVFDTATEQYLHQHEAQRLAEQLGLLYVPTFYEGTFAGWDELMQYLGKTAMGGEFGEGIVVKDMTEGFYTKIVCEQFREVHKSKKPDSMRERKQRKLSSIPTQCTEIITKARVVKLLHKMVDDGIIPETWSNADIKTISGELPKRVYFDCVKEENDTVQQIENFGKYAATLSMAIVKEIILENNGLVSMNSDDT